ncbi:MAG TPA: PAS domain S-box protein, partial [Burkholderiaceae bacterium]|nr:PAS domain S-box protein [Burkholderiaceae bacterium]
MRTPPGLAPRTRRPQTTPRFAPLGIGAKLTLGFGALAAVALLVVALAYVAGRDATADIDLTEGVRGPASLASAQAQASLLRMQLHVRGYLVLSDRADIEQYHAARQDFEKSLAALQAMSRSWPEEDAAKQVAELTVAYENWVKLPQQLFDLHDNPLENRPALRLARVGVQALRVQVLDEVDTMIAIQKARESTPQNRELLADLVDFQTSFDAMATNLMAYAASGEPTFKLGYGPQLGAAVWNSLAAKHERLTAEQQARLDVIAKRRAEIAQLALRIVSVMNSEHAYQDLYLYRTQVVPQAQALLGLLTSVTTHQQGQLQAGLAHARRSLANARLQTAAGGAFAVALAIGMAFLFRRHIVGPVRRLTGVAERVAHGDLSARAQVEVHDEIGTLATSINTMTQRLVQTIDHLESVFADAQRAGVEARAAEEKYRGIFENAVEGIFQTTPDGRILTGNPAMARMLGYPDTASLLAVNVVELYVNPEDRKRWQDALERDGAVRDFEVQLRRRDGTLVWLSNSSRVVRDAGGRLLYYEGTLEDVTERKRAHANAQRLIREEAARQQAEVARDDMARLSEMIGLLQSCATVVELRAVVARQLARIFEGDDGALYLLAPGQHVVEIATAWGRSPPSADGFVPADCWAMRRGLPHIVERGPNALRCRHAREHIPTYACLPLIAQGEALGFLHVCCTGPRSAEERRHFLQTVAENL